MDPKNKKLIFPSAKQVVLTSFLVDVSDILLSLLVTILTGSVIMLVEVLEGISDFVASGALVIGVNRAKSQPDKQFPFGYGREVYFWTFISAMIIIGITATFSLYFGWDRFLHPHKIQNIALAYAVLTITTLTNAYAFILSVIRLRAKTNTINILSAFFRSSLIETKTTFVLDFVGTSASLVGLLALIFYQLTGDRRLDGLGAMGVGVILVVFGVLLILGIRDLVIGKSASPETLSLIRKVALENPEVEDVIDVKTMHIGSERLLVNMDISMKSGLKTHEIAKLIEGIKEKIQKEIPAIKHIHLELELPS